eukprot:765384-Hanusia_phi.AAC.1
MEDLLQMIRVEQNGGRKGITADKVEIEKEKLGSGAHGTVYRGSLSMKDKKYPVAIKVVEAATKEAVKSIEREMDILLTIRHPNIVCVITLIPQNASKEVWAVLELLDLGSLKRVIAVCAAAASQSDASKEEWKSCAAEMAVCLSASSEGQRFELTMWILLLIAAFSVVDNVATAIGKLFGGFVPGESGAFYRILVQQVKALDYLHSLNIIHGDIKTDNVLVSSKGETKLADFGVARFMQTTLGGTVATATHRARGTYGYMAPEIQRDEPTDKKSDVYSLSMVAYEMLDGRPPFHDKTNPIALMKAVDNGERPVLPPTASPALKDLVETDGIAWREAWLRQGGRDQIQDQEGSIQGVTRADHTRAS